MYSGYQGHLKQYQIHLFLTAELSCKAILLSATKMLLLLVAAGGAKMNLISIEHLNCFIKF